ncbi:MAG TPA: vWA domain-containing protein [Kofleriaceae bacterium]|jgi:hypothetical protein|nr:vWA domain-containing protein [Kofleriaceae bacterium]
MRWLAVLVLVLAGPRAALADKVAAAGDDYVDGSLDPRRVTGHLAGTTIELTAQYEIATDSFFQSGLQLSLPEGSIITQAVATAGGKRHPFSLLDATEAQKAMDVFWSDNAPVGNHRWGIHITASANTALIDIAPVNAAKIVLDLTVELPGCFYRDRRYGLVPKTWSAKFAGAKTKDDDTLTAGCGSSNLVEDHEWVSFAAPVLAKRPLGDARIGAFAGRLPLGHEDLARVEIDLASELTRVPPDLHTAIVIDHSRSLSGDEVETERAVVASYMEHVPAQTRVQVIAFARHVTPLLAAWMPAASARARIDREIRALAPRNGSNVDEAIAEAGRWLSSVKGTRRLIVIGDDRLNTRVESMTGAELKALLPENTLVHVVSVSMGTTGLQLIDRTELAGLADLTEGIAVGAGLDNSSDHPSLDASMLVRPLGLDNLVIKGRGWNDMGMTTCPVEGTALAEGDSCVFWAKGSAIASAMTVEAFLWGHKVTRTLLPDTTSARHLARELSGSDEFFDDDFRNRIDRAALAVNSAWSLVATWGGTAGRNEDGGFGFGRSGFGPGCCGDTGIRDTIGFTTGMIRPKLDLKAQIAPIVKKCGAKASLKIYLHTTLEEIDELRVTTSEPATVQTCIEEGLWDLAIAIPNAPWQASTTVAFD